MKCALLLSVSMIFLAPPAFGDEPPIPCCSCTLDVLNGLILIPAGDSTDPMSSFTVTVRNSDCVPIEHAIVECLIGGIPESKVAICPSTVLRGETDANGVVTFTIPGGGCYKGANAFVIRANGIDIRNYQSVTSPDYAASDNSGQPHRWDLRVGLTDLTAFAVAYRTGGPSCHDYDNNGATNLADFALFGRFWIVGATGCQ